MAKFIVTYTSREEIEVEASNEEDAVGIAQNINQSRFTLIDNDWSAKRASEDVDVEG